MSQLADSVNHTREKRRILPSHPPRNCVTRSAALPSVLRRRGKNIDQNSLVLTKGGSLPLPAGMQNSRRLVRQKFTRRKMWHFQSHIQCESTLVEDRSICWLLIQRQNQRDSAYYIGTKSNVWPRVGNRSNLLVSDPAATPPPFPDAPRRACKSSSCSHHYGPRAPAPSVCRHPLRADA